MTDSDHARLQQAIATMIQKAIAEGIEVTPEFIYLRGGVDTITSLLMASKLTGTPVENGMAIVGMNYLERLKELKKPKTPA